MRVTLPRDKSVTEYNLGVALRDARSFDYLDVTISKEKRYSYWCRPRVFSQVTKLSSMALIMRHDALNRPNPHRSAAAEIFNFRLIHIYSKSNYIIKIVSKTLIEICCPSKDALSCQRHQHDFKCKT